MKHCFQVFSAADVVSSASNSAELLFTLDEQAVQYIEISPRALWLVTWRKPVDEQGSTTSSYGPFHTYDMIWQTGMQQFGVCVRANVCFDDAERCLTSPQTEFRFSLM